MILTHETAHALNQLIQGVDMPPPNGDTPHWEVQAVEAIRAADPARRMAVFKGMFGARPDWINISAEVLAADVARPEAPRPITLPVNGDGERLAEKLYKSTHYIDVYKQLGYTFRLCDLDDRVEVNDKPLSDVTEAELRTAIRDHGIWRVAVARDAYITEAARNRYHPIRDYFKRLPGWDGGDHIAKLAAYFSDTHGAFPMVLRLWLVGVIAKATNAERTRMLILDGPQNIGKSSFARWLCSPLAYHFNESAINPDSNDHKLRLIRSFIWEVSELGSTMRRQDIEALKAFLTQRQVTARAPYAHHDVIKPALASFIGTVNNIGGILSDPTGNSRFMTVNITAIDWQGYITECNIHQIWAQALALYKTGAPWEPRAKQLDIIDAINQEYEVQDPMIDLIARHFEIDLDNQDWFTPTLDVIQVLHDNGWRGNNPRAEAMMLAPAMKKLGLTKVKRWHVNTVLQGYEGLKKRFQPTT